MSGNDPRLETRLFHAIVLVGAALASSSLGCGGVDGSCVETISDAASDQRLAQGDACPIEPPPSPILDLEDASAPGDASVGPDVQPWPPTKC